MFRDPEIHKIGWNKYGDLGFLLVMEVGRKVDGVVKPGTIYGTSVIIPAEVSDTNALFYATAMRNGWQRIMNDVMKGRTQFEGATYLEESPAGRWISVDGDPGRLDATEVTIAPIMCTFGKETVWQQLKRWAGTLIPKRNFGARS